MIQLKRVYEEPVRMMAPGSLWSASGRGGPRYVAELDKRPEAWEPILDAARHGTVTLLYSSRDTEHNNALALKRFLEAKLARRAPEARKKGMSNAT